MSFYKELASARQDDEQLQATVRDTIDKLRANSTAVDRPGILLGKIQSGKTRAFLGVIAAAFDDGYDGSIVLTKGTRSLAFQTMSRLQADFGVFHKRDELQMFDILNLPPSLSRFELQQKLIIVAKKEDDNLRRLLTLFNKTYTSLKERRWLIIDDEADFASLSFRKNGDIIEPGIINQQIESLRSALAQSQFLEVTATPYSLYLQPEAGLKRNGIPILKPRKPQFTVVLPTHKAYVGGDFYFEQSLDATSPASLFYQEVPADERDALKKEDGRRFKIEDVLTTPKVAVLRRAIVNFIVGASIRRMQQSMSNVQPEKYSFVVHTEQQKASHEWQLRVVEALWQGLQSEAHVSGGILRSLIAESYDDLAASIRLTNEPLPASKEVEDASIDAIKNDHLIATKVNSEHQIEALLDESGQLRLRTPMNLFIGGQILDRGITIGNLIGFYYGRTPQKSQQDTVLQHSRMYGARPHADLGVTRLYAPLAVYNRMSQIHELDAALREAFLSGANDRGVYFVETDGSGQIMPCAPNKLLASEVYAMRPGRRLLPLQFNTVAIARGASRLQKLDDIVHSVFPAAHQEPVLVDVAMAIEMIELAYSNLVFNDEEEGKASLKALIAALDWLTRSSADGPSQGRLWLIAAEDRSVVRIREGGRFANAPDTKQQQDAADRLGTRAPVLTMLRQNGTEKDGWRGLPFWWPVVRVPNDATTSVYSAN